jgi:hypothetical protein
MKDFIIFLIVFGTSHLYFVRHSKFRTKHSVSDSCQQHLCSVMCAATCYAYYIKNTVQKDGQKNNNSSIFINKNV